MSMNKRPRVSIRYLVVSAAAVFAAVFLPLGVYSASSIPLEDRWLLANALGSVEVRRGWPWPYCTARMAGPRSVPQGSEAIRVSISKLCGNIAVAAIFASVASAIWVTHLYRRGGAFQFSLCELFCCVGVVAVAFGWWGTCIRAYQRERQAVAKLEDNGWRSFVGGFPEVRGWIARLLHDAHTPGRECLWRVQALSWDQHDAGDRAFGRVKIDEIDEILKRSEPDLRALQYCQYVVINDDGLTDSGVFSLCESVSDCRFLELSGSELVTDAGIRRIIRAWPKIESLALAGIGVTDEGMAQLEALPHLTTLEVRHCPQVSTNGIRTALGFPALRHLTIPLDLATTDDLFDQAIASGLSVSLSD